MGAPRVLQEQPWRQTPGTEQGAPGALTWEALGQHSSRSLPQGVGASYRWEVKARGCLALSLVTRPLVAELMLLEGCSQLAAPLDAASQVS